MKNDIVDKINTFIERTDNARFIPKQEALHILDTLLEECPEDKVLVDTMRMCIEKYWSAGNIELLENFYDILRYMNILPSELLIENRKSIRVKKGNMIAKKMFSSKNTEYINNILKKYN